jgi:Domain of unknown function (DUF4902)
MLEADRDDGRVPLLGIALSEDGYVRLSQARMRAIPLVHLISGLDADPAGPDTGAVGATRAAIAGYTEWLSLTIPALSLGWDWALESADRELRYQRVGEPRSNIMLLDSHGRDLGPISSAVALALLVDEFNWQDTVASFVRTRYS